MSLHPSLKARPPHRQSKTQPQQARASARKKGLRNGTVAYRDFSDWAHLPYVPPSGSRWSIYSRD
ncbi:MAG: hypothetical protein V4474_04455 [Patescibacteria group bacterium]